MNSIIFQTISRFLTVTLYCIALWLLYRGHNLPGGGFVAGLVVGVAFSIKALAFGIQTLPNFIKNSSIELVGWGLLIAAFAGVIPFFYEKPFLTGIWYEIPLYWTSFPLGSPVIFDIGVFLVVLGVVTKIIVTLLENEQTQDHTKEKRTT
jgi:multicomponent Na+:H+ antiporter subunit B